MTADRKYKHNKMVERKLKLRAKENRHYGKRLVSW